MHPVLGRIFGLEIYGYGTALATAFLTAVVLAILLGRKRGLKPDPIIDVAIVACIGGLLGARLVYILVSLDDYLRYPALFLEFRSGFSFVGGALGGALAGIIFARKKRLPVWTLADVAALVIPLAYSIGRVGCLLRGCCYGIPTRVPWALVCGPGHILRHPTQVYSSIGGLIIFAILWPQRSHQRFRGFLLAQFGFLYSIERFVVEFFREGDPFWLGLHMTQVFTLLSAAATALLIVLIERRRIRGGRARDERYSHPDIQG